MAGCVMAKVASGATVRVGGQLRAPGASGQQETTSVAVALPVKDRFSRTGGQDLDVAAVAAKLQAKSQQASGSPALAVGKALLAAGKDLVGDQDLGATLANAADTAAKKTLEGIAWLADATGLRQPTAAQVTEAKDKTERVMKAFDPQNTGFVAGEQLAKWAGPKGVQATLAFTDTDQDGKLSGAEIQRAFTRKAMDRDTKAELALGGDLAVNGGARVSAGVTLDAGLKPGMRPRITGEINVGPDVLRMVRSMAYQQTRQAIRSRQMPVMEVPAMAKEALGKLGAYNQGGSLEGALAINLSNPALVEAVRQGVTQGIKDQPLRNRFLLRPRGMWRLRARIAEALVVQYKIESHVAAAVNQVERQVEVLSNGVVVFQDARPARTGAGVSYHGNGFDVAMQSDVQDVQRWMPR